MKLLKYLIECSLSSRRDLIKKIRNGHVLVNNVVELEPSKEIEPNKDRVTYEGQVVKPQRKVYYLVNKPKGYVCTTRDIKRRPSVLGLVPANPLVFPVGRLDVNSEGLIILTNDGELANLISHPRYQVEKTYWVHINQFIPNELIIKISKGVWLAEGKTLPAKIRVIKRTRSFSILLITLKEGKKREIRRIFARYKIKVKGLKRISIGNLSLSNIPRGGYLEVSRDFIINHIPQLRSQ